MEDDTIVQDTSVQAETDTTTSDETSEKAIPDPLVEMEARLDAKYAEKLEDANRKWQSISNRDVKAANREAAGHRREAEKNRTILDSMKTNPALSKQIPYYENMAAAQTLRQQDSGKAEEEAKAEFFEITRERVADMVDVNDSRIDWASDATDIRKANDRIWKSVSKMVKEDSVKTMERLRKEARDELKDTEANKRRDDGIDTVDGTISGAGYASGDLGKILKVTKNPREAKAALDKYIKGA